MKFFKKTDLYIITAIACIAVIMLFAYKFVTNSIPAKAEIYYYSELIDSIPLTPGRDVEITVPQAPAVLIHLHADGTIAFEESDCPDKICINSGNLSRVGESAACIPNGVLVKIVPAGKANSGDPDLIIGY